MEAAKTLAPRRIWIAALLSFLGAGLGQLYVGRGTRGAVFFAIQLLHVPLIASLAFAEPSPWVLWALLGLVAFGMAFFVYVLVDAVLLASRALKPHLAKAYNSGALYVALAVLSAMWGALGMSWIRDHTFEAFQISTRSMEPTIGLGDRILVNKSGLAPVHGDLIVFRAPGKSRVNYVKRLIGLPGDRIEMFGDVIRINGEAVASNVSRRKPGTPYVMSERYGGRTWQVKAVTPPPDRVSSGESYEVPAGHGFVLGDHRWNSRDSRRFGFVPLDDVVGVAQYLFWPFRSSRFGVLR